MSGKNKLMQAPPYDVETALRHLGANLRTARLRRNLTIAEMAEKIGTGPRAVTDAEKGKVGTGIGTYAALLWVVGLLDQLEAVADPEHDEEGQLLARFKERKRASKVRDLDNDF